MLTSCEIDNYNIVIDDIASINGLGESNDDLVMAALEDVNMIIRAGLHRVDINTLQSKTVEYIINNVIRNREDVTDYVLMKANECAAWIMTSILGTLMQMSDIFYMCQIDLNDTTIYERDYTEFVCQVRLSAYQAYEYDEDSTCDAARLVNAVFKMYALGAKECEGVRREIQAIFRAY